MAARAKTVVAKRAFVHLDGVRYTAVQGGERLPASSPIVKAHPEQFDGVAKPTRRRSTKP
jgi:hypothetical protein